MVSDILVVHELLNRKLTLQPMPEAHASLERPLLTIGQGWAVYVGPVEPGRPHRHQASQLAWCTTGTLKLEGAWGTLEAHGHVLPAGELHRLVASQPVRMLFVDPGMTSGTSAEEVTPLTVSQASALERELLNWLHNPTTSSAPHERVYAAQGGRWPDILNWLDQKLDGTVRAEDAAAAVGLSPSHFMHWFRQASGLSFRAFVRWLRLQRAVRTLSTGATLTEAAHLAGFADSAHLSRTFVATFGVRAAPLRSARIVCSDAVQPPISGLGNLAAELHMQVG
jgi:AraC-like DNA-binding protein